MGIFGTVEGSHDSRGEIIMDDLEGISTMGDVQYIGAGP